MDVVVNFGNSGGVFVDVEGCLLGINMVIVICIGMFQGYLFVIFVNLVMCIVDDIIEFGSFQCVFLGVSIYLLDVDVVMELGVDINQGVVIDELVDGGLV